MMVFYVTGSNIFGQWSCEDIIISEFRAISGQTCNSLIQTKLLQISWAYNILSIDDSLYISGVWDGKENQLIKIPLPSDYSKRRKDFIVAGNDYNLVFVGEDSCKLWVMDLKMEKETKTINFNIEEPMGDVTKKQKRNSNVKKIVLVNNSCLYLTSERHVYCGILPSFVDTGHCTGNICDIQCGNEHYILLTDTGMVYTWGNGRRLQLGHGDVSNVEQPTQVQALAGIKIIKISSGGWHSLALSEFGDVYAWGWNDTGQLGIKQEKEGQESYSVPTLVDLFNSNGQEVRMNVKDIACGSRHSAIVLEDNSVWTTGFNKYGQLGFSKDKHPVLNSFKKAFQCDNSSLLMCGPWTTVIVPEK